MVQPNAHNNELLGKELKYFSQAGFDLDRIHIKVSPATVAPRPRGRGRVVTVFTLTGVTPLG